MSNLIKHAEAEMKLAGLDKPDSDYGGMLYDAVMGLVKAHAGQGHSGFSHSMAIAIFNKVVNFKTLTPISSSPDEWMEVGKDRGGGEIWQNLRQSSCFSLNGGKTWYDIDDKTKKNWPNQNFFQRTWNLFQVRGK